MASSSLATIMFTDLVDSTGQRARIGDDAADLVVAAHDRIVTEAAERHGGRVVKTLGDGALAIFPSALDAVGAGVDICDEADDRTSPGPSGQDLSIRVGIHAGEVATGEDGDVSGFPVAVAARVCGVAEAGQVVLTPVVRSLLGSRGDVTLVSLGPHALKGVAETMELWTVAEGHATGAPMPSAPIPYPSFLTRAVPASLVGRDEERDRLDTAFSQASDGRSVFVAIVGEPGIGKTALTSTWARSAADRGATIIGGRCTPEGALPYQPFIEVARSILGAQPGRLTDLGPAAGNMAILVPSVPTPPHLPAPAQADPDTMRYLMADAFVTLMTPRADEPTTVVVIDDLQWADEGSIGVLAHLARLEERHRIVIVGTYRDTDLVRSHPLPRLLADLRRERRIDRIVLDTLGTHEVAEMVSARVGHAIAADVITSIAAETKGNPFFVAEMVAHLLDEGAIDASGQWTSDVPIEDYGIPEGVRDVIGRRIERLGDDASSFFEVAAIVGPTFRIGLVGRVAGLDENTVETVVDQSVAAGLLTEGDTVEEAAFAHALVRQTVDEELSPRRRVRLHRAVATALEEADAPATETLPHWLTANEPVRALPAAIRAASEVRTASGQVEAMQHLELAMDLWEDVDDPETVAGIEHAELVMEVSVVWADFAMEQSRAMDLIDREIAMEPTDPTMLARLYARKSEHFWQIGDIAAADEYLDLALDTIPSDEPSGELAVLQSYTAGRLMTAGQYQDAIVEARKALSMIETMEADAPMAAKMRAAVVMGTSMLATGNIEEGDHWFEQLAEMAAATGNVRSRNTRSMNQGEGYRINGRYEDAIALYEEGIRASREVGADRWVSGLTANVAEVLFITGRWDEATDRLEALPVSPDLDFPELSVIGNQLLLAAERGDDEAFEALMERLGNYDVANQEQQVNAAIYEAMISHLRWTRRFAEAYETAVDAMASWGNLTHLTEAAAATAIAVGAVADAAEEGTAPDDWLDAARMWNDRLAASETPEPQVGVWKAIGQAELARAERSEDPGLWRDALARAADRPYVEALIQWRLARSLEPSDSANTEVDSLLDAARNTATRLGAAPLVTALG